MEKHAIRKADVAWALASESKTNRRGRLKTHVSGKGQYKVWTGPAMLRAALLGTWQCVGLAGVIFSQDPDQIEIEIEIMVDS